MKPIDQTRFGSTDGNCFAACVASIFEIPIEDAPDVMRLDNWYDAFADWLKPRGFYPLCFPCSDPSNGWAPAGLYILSGKSPRGDFDHAVVAKGSDIIHDPHPSRDGIKSRVDQIIFVQIDPSKKI